ncbi:MAG: hypothetical protein AAFY41_09470 [Bacteroidota bacterium]
MKGDAPRVKRSEKKNLKQVQSDTRKNQRDNKKEAQIPDGDLQAKLAKLKGKWGS